MQQREIDVDEADEIGRTLRAGRAHGLSMKQLAALLLRRHGIGCTPSTVWALMAELAPPGRANWAGGRDPGRKLAKGTPRNPRRKASWYRYTWQYRDRTQFGDL